MLFWLPSQKITFLFFRSSCQQWHGIRMITLIMKGQWFYLMSLHLLLGKIYFCVSARTTFFHFQNNLVQTYWGKRSAISVNCPSELWLRGRGFMFYRILGFFLGLAIGLLAKYVLTIQLHLRTFLLVKFLLNDAKPSKGWLSSFVVTYNITQGSSPVVCGSN